MIILKDILEDFLYFPNLTYSLEDTLENFGLKVLETNNFAVKYSDIRVVKVKSYQGFNEDRNLHHYLDNFSEDVFSEIELDIEDVIVLKDSDKLYTYEDLAEIPFLEGEGVVKLPSFYNYGTSLANSLNIAYTFYEVDDSENTFNSYYSLALAISEKDGFPFLEPEIITVNEIKTIDKPEGLDDVDEFNLAITAEDTKIPSWLRMRLKIHDIHPQSLAEALQAYLKLEYNFNLNLLIHEDYFIYSISEENKKAFARLQEFWEQTAKIQVFEFK